MPRTRFLMIGGFLGAGKTTTIARLARHFTDAGLRVGLVTNDQAYGLVDTETLRAQGFHVGEVPGACFCCKFDDLVDTAAALGADGQPDIILTEPVGSCTDLMATVLRPLSHLFGDRYDLGPLAVLCKPEHGRKILGGGSGGFSPQAAYIFLKQLEEAQLIVLNKVDRLSEEEQRTLLGLLRDRFPNKRVLPASGVTGHGFDALIGALESDRFMADAPGAIQLPNGQLPNGQLPSERLPDAAPLDIDYDTYAAGEAALGWLNCSVELAGEGEKLWSLDEIVQQLVRQFCTALLAADMEPGHVKVLGNAGPDAASSATAVANWVASDAPVELSVASGIEVPVAHVLVNVRVHGAPDTLAKLVKTSIAAVAERQGLAYEISAVQHFSPGRPEPTHRYVTATGPG